MLLNIIKEKENTNVLFKKTCGAGFGCCGFVFLEYRHVVTFVYDSVIFIGLASTRRLAKAEIYSGKGFLWTQNGRKSRELLSTRPQDLRHLNTQG